MGDQVVKTVWHWPEVIRYFVLCVLLIPMIAGGLIWLAQRFVSVPVWAAIFFGLVVGTISTLVYMAIRPRMWHFEEREVEKY